MAISSMSQPKSVASRAGRALNARLQHGPHVLGGSRLKKRRSRIIASSTCRRRGDAAIVEVDHGAVGVESALDLAPVCLVVGHGRGRATFAGDFVGPEEIAEGVLAKNGGNRDGAGEALDE